MKNHETFQPMTPSSMVNRQLATWREIYRDYFGVQLGLVMIPVHCKGFDRLIVPAHGTTIQQGHDVCKKLFPCWNVGYNLDEAVPTNDRKPINGAYAVWVRDRIEADEELKNLSANDLASQGISTETVLERELHEIVYFLETGKHLDIKNVTLIVGSRSNDGRVPSAGWDDGKFGVRAYWRHPSRARGHLRGRQVVS